MCAAKVECEVCLSSIPIRFAAIAYQESPKMLNFAQAAPPAPAPAQENLLQVVTSVFSRPDTLAHPEDLMRHLQSMSVIWAVVFLTAGLVCILNGYKFYKPVTVILALLIGASVGWALGQRIEAESSITAGCFGALMAAACLPLMKYAVAIMGGLSGSFIGANTWTSVGDLIANNAGKVNNSAETCWIGALIGLVVFGMLAFILFKLSVVLFTSVSGSTLAVMGAMALLLQVPQWQTSVTESMKSHTIVLPMLVLVPAIIGLILQESQADVAPAGPAKKKE